MMRLGASAISKRRSKKIRRVVSRFTALLDDYPGAAAAYSLRLLDTTYAGSAIRVRRASDNAEQDIGFDNNELDTSALATFCSGTDGFVKTWYDQSGNGNDASQTTTSDQPQIVASGAIIVKDLINTIDFASLDLLQSGAGVIGNVSGLSFAYVGAFKSTGTSNQILFAASNGAYGGPSQWIALRQSSSLNQFTLNSGSNFSVNNGTANSSMRSFFGSFVGSSQVELSVDGSNATSATSASSVDLSQEIDLSMVDNKGSMILKTNQYGCELIIWPSDQSSNRTGIEDNINAFYSIYE